LTKTATRTVIVLVGLPARGKSFVSRKLLHFLNWTGVQCKVFNVGKYRREAYAEMLAATATTPREMSGACDANFFDANNEKAAELRERVAECALRDMLRWLDHEDESDSDEEYVHDTSKHSAVSSISTSSAGIAKLNFRNHERVAIFDATNSTEKRRQWILEECTSLLKRGDKQTGLVFVESICDDTELLEENYRYKVSSSPDFNGMPEADALHDLRNRVAKYEAQYETILDDTLSYIKIFNLSTKLMVNHIYGRMAKEVVPALMAWHIGTRPVFLCRPGQTLSGILTDGEDYVNRQTMDLTRFQNMSRSLQRRSLRGDTLGPNGQRFRQDLFDFLFEEGHQFMKKRASVRDMANTGTSISGLRPGPGSGNVNEMIYTDTSSIAESRSNILEPFPLRIYTSTMPRAADTVSWDDFKLIQRSNLNPLDKGDFAGQELDEIKIANPTWFAKLERDPYNTRCVTLQSLIFLNGNLHTNSCNRLLLFFLYLSSTKIPRR
jgi:6-phosphofructo-2-kinase